MAVGIDGVIRDFVVKLGFDGSDVINGIKATEKAISKELNKSKNNSDKDKLAKALNKIDALNRKIERGAEKSHSNKMRRMSQHNREIRKQEALESRKDRMMNAYEITRGRFDFATTQQGGINPKLEANPEYVNYKNLSNKFNEAAGVAKTRKDLEGLRRTYDQLKASQSKVISLNKQLNHQFSVQNFTVKSLTDSTRNLARSHLSVFAAVGAGGAVTSKGQELISLRAALLGVSGDAKVAAEEFEFVKNTSKSLGINLTEATRSYGKLGAAAKSAGLSAEQGKEIFLATSELSTAFGLSEVEYEGISRAMGQILSKGKVSTEELLQLGERVPIIMDTAAKSLGVSTRELYKEIEKGNIQSVDFAPEVIKQWRQYVRETGMLEAQMKSSRVAMSRFGTTFQEQVLDKFDAGLEGGLAQFFNQMSTWMDNTGPLFRGLGSFIGLMLRLGSTFLLVGQQFFRPFIMMMDSFVGATEDATGKTNAFGKALAFVGWVLTLLPAAMEAWNDKIQETDGWTKGFLTSITAIAVAFLALAKGGGKLMFIFRLLTGLQLIRLALQFIVGLGSKLMGLFSAPAFMKFLTKAKDVANVAKPYVAKWAAGRVASAPLNGVPIVGQALWAGAGVASAAYTGYQAGGAIYDAATGNTNYMTINIDGSKDPKSTGQAVQKVLEEWSLMSDTSY